MQERYRPLRPIGQGGFGKTFFAVDEKSDLHLPCAIKQFSFPNQDPESYNTAARLFRQEALRLKQLGQHPQIPQLLSDFEEDGRLYLVQEFIEGQTLTQLLRQNGIFNHIEIWKLLQDLLPVLHFIHQKSIVHRDIKPSNIISRIGDGKPVLIDFGVAKLVADTALVRTGTIIGSPEYMAPEQTRGKAIAASDLFSLGVTCIHLMTGVTPWDMYDMTKDYWGWRDFLPTNISGNSLSVPPQQARLGKILDKLLQHSVSQRYQSAEQVLQDLIIPDIAISKKTAIVKSQITPTPAVSAPVRPNLLAKIMPWIVKPTGDSLISAVGVDYTNLQHLLAAKKWKEADWETWVVLSQALGKRTKGYIHPNEIEGLPCADLGTINGLWVKYSGGQFGYTVQKQIYDGVDGDYGQFCDRVGWLTYNPHNASEYLIFRLNAPLGHLPSRIWVTGLKWWRHTEVMGNRLKECEVYSTKL
ncbi:serine/threonine protein kinase [Oscillatoriales cyanobacterium USR001]|nr:serine/threonine protein kinase [Oscillatoriales cyanobacterium USR001]